MSTYVYSQANRCGAIRVCKGVGEDTHATAHGLLGGCTIAGYRNQIKGGQLFWSEEVYLLFICEACLDHPLPCTQILLACEAHLQGTVLSTRLGFILTAGDILKYLELKASPRPPPSPFPDISRDSLPPNLSVQTATRVKSKEKRIPFHNQPNFPTNKRQRTQHKLF